MASLGMHMHNGAIKDCVIHKQHERSPRVSIFTTPNLIGKRVSTAVNAAVTYDSGRNSAVSISDYILDSQLRTNEHKLNDRSLIESPSVLENLDEWMRNSVTEIVKNITQVPLLIQIYADGEVKMEKAGKLKEWKHRSPSALQGVILVEELTDATVFSDKVEEEEEDGDRAFGVLIQGKVKGKCKSTCYLLKTSSVYCGDRLGFVCTHFCLMKVKSFHENVFSQFRDCWLV